MKNRYKPRVFKLDCISIYRNSPEFVIHFRGYACLPVEHFLINYPRRSRGKRGLLSKLSSLTNHSQTTWTMAARVGKCERFPFSLWKPHYCFTKLPETRPRHPPLQSRPPFSSLLKTYFRKKNSESWDAG